MALKGMEPAPNPQQRGGSKNLEGGHLSLLRQRQNMKGMSQLSKVKQNIHQHKDKSCNLKKT